jgi:hypothetical protein
MLILLHIFEVVPHLFLYEAWSLISKEARKNVVEQTVKKNFWIKEILNSELMELLNCFAIIVLFV